MDPAFNAAGNYGALSVMVDPVRPSDVYVAVCYQGLWKSTDYGLTWRKVNTGANSDKIDIGRPSMAIDPNPRRDPATPPTFYSNSLYGASGLWKSTNGGVDWVDVWKSVRAADGSTDITQAVGSDAGAPVVDPQDSQHLIVGMHGSVGYGDHVFESTNGGATWIDKGPVGRDSLQVFLIDRNTWIAQGDYFHSGDTRKTTNGGATWTITGPGIGHPHGGSSLLNLGSGQLYLAAIGGLYRSTNNGDSWTKVPNSTDSSVVVATPKRLYTSYGWAWLGGVEPQLGHVDRSGNNWVADPAPVGMNNGGVAWAVTTDGTRHIVIGANWNGGVWRYVEPQN
jgi:hypothetical protein